jgi:hypothetical protein
MRRLFSLSIVVVFVSAAMLSVGCYDTADKEIAADCEPDSVRSCECSDGEAGEQLCRDDGTWERCASCGGVAVDSDGTDSHGVDDDATDIDIDMNTDTYNGPSYDIDTTFLLNLDTDAVLECDDITEVEVCLGCYCLSELLTCEGNQACMDLIYCIADCTTEACLTDCTVNHSDGASDLLALANCGDANCNGFYLFYL